MNKTIWIFIILVLVILGGVYLSRSSDNAPVMMEEKSDAMTDDNTESKDGGEMMAEDTMMEVGSYVAYDVSKLALAETGDVVLFFRASWCPTCRALDADVKNNLSNIPAGLTILDVDYDNSTALKQKYGVTMQHTLVQVDSAGNLISKWTGSPTLVSLVGNVK